METPVQFTREVLYYGEPKPLPLQHVLTAGTLRAIYESGSIRYVKLGGHEVVRRIYSAVRDHNWDTVEPVIYDESVLEGEKSFRVSYTCTYKAGDIHFVARYLITGDEQGTIRFEMKGQAQTSFRKNRLGFCVLHPITGCAGQPCEVKEPDGSITQGTFPAYISPHQPFLNIKEMQWPLQEGAAARLLFEGEVFEMEDQRNWTDASYKTYCTPLGRPFPVLVQAGEEIEQAVELRLAGKTVAGNRPAEAATLAEFFISATETRPLPVIGVGQSSEQEELSKKDVAAVRAFGFHHYRVEVKLEEPGWQRSFKKRIGEAKALHLHLEIALEVVEKEEAAVDGFILECQTGQVPIHCILLFQKGAKATPAELIEAVVPRLRSQLPGVKIGVGTNVYFTELNRNRPPFQGADFLTFSINPQVHAFDLSSLTEALEAQAFVVKSAQQLAPGKPVQVSPVTLKPRFNPNATGPEPELPLGELPPQVDLRQASLFGAAWTVGSIKYLAEAGAESITYYETMGRRGLMLSNTDSALSSRFFPATPGSVFPLAAIFKDVLEFAGAEVLTSRSTAPLTFDGLVLRKGAFLRILLANYSANEQKIQLQAKPGQATVRQLSAAVLAEQQDWFDQYFAAPPENVSEQKGFWIVTLQPFAVATIDVQTG